jgi:hypothetical protein
MQYVPQDVFNRIRSKVPIGTDPKAGEKGCRADRYEKPFNPVAGKIVRLRQAYAVEHKDHETALYPLKSLHSLKNGAQIIPIAALASCAKSASFSRQKLTHFASNLFRESCRSKPAQASRLSAPMTPDSTGERVSARMRPAAIGPHSSRGQPCPKRTSASPFKRAPRCIALMYHRRRLCGQRLQITN